MAGTRVRAGWQKTRDACTKTWFAAQKTGYRRGRRLKNKIFQSRDLCLRALDTNSICAKNVRRNERRK